VEGSFGVIAAGHALNRTEVCSRLGEYAASKHALVDNLLTAGVVLEHGIVPLPA
jgi:hypothetical protein